jgi:hypothetical protein
LISRVAKIVLKKLYFAYSATNKAAKNANIIIFLILDNANFARRFSKIVRFVIIKHVKYVKEGF